MKQLGLIVGAVVVAVLVASCAPKAQVAKDAGTEETGKAAAPAPDTAAAPAPAPAEAPAPAAAEGGPKVVVLDIGDQRDEKTQKVTHQTREFTMGSPKIYVFIGLKGLTTGQKVKGVIQLIDGKAKDGEVLRDTEIASVELAAPDPESHFNLVYGPPKNGWPVGKYEFRASSEGKVFETDELTVK
jgi:hypothetical protein